MSITPFSCDDLTSYSSMLVKRSSCTNLRGGFAGDGNDASVQFTSHSKDTNIDTNTKNYLRMHMAWAAANASTLAYTGVDNTVERPVSATGGNVKVQGLIEPVADNDLANKAYVDSKLSTYFNVNNPAKALVITKLSDLNNWNPAGDGQTFEVDAVGAFSNPVAGASVDVDGITLNLTALLNSDERLLVVNASGGSHPTANTAAMNGVYVLTAVVGVLLTFTRTSDLNTIAGLDHVGIEKGDYVLVSNPTAIHHGMGFFLNSDTTGFGNTDNATNNQDWAQFAAHTVGDFSAPMHNDADTVSIRGATNGSDENRVLVAGGVGVVGKVQIADRMGRNDTPFVVNATALTVGESGQTVTLATTVTTLKLPDLTAPGLSAGTPNVTFDSSTELKLDGTTHDNSVFQEKCTVAKVAAGSTPLELTAGAFKYDTVTAMGAVNIQTEGFDQAVVTVETGSGVLLDAVTVPAQFTGNDNEGRFYLSAYKTAGNPSDECRFSIFNFHKSTHATLANKANPLVTFI